ncbi:MAG: PspA/IM30 family protein [Cyanobacteria bacterium REEB67]|nr:PspA/IM30 family protein [Cyanobacteria bacterium REEB67]
MFERLMNIFKGSANKAVSKLETPEILAEQASMQLEGNLKSLTEAVTAALTNQKQIEQQLQKNQEELATWEKRAAVAVQNNNDEIARQCLERKVTHNQNIQSLNTQLAEQKKTLAALKQQYAEMEEQLRLFNIKKQGIIARAKAAENQVKANSIASGADSNSMDKWEEKIRAKEMQGQAVSELSGAKVDDDFKAMDKNAALDDELAALKAKVAAPDAASAISPAVPKLIVAGDGHDENLPMVVDVEVSEPGENK